jgi:pyrroloquinoline-quinone synthase
MATKNGKQHKAKALTPDKFAAALRAQEEHYHCKHPFHIGMHKGHLNRKQIQGWVANRFYYQKTLPLKDAAILSNCPHAAIRRRWMERIVDQDGTRAGQGGLEGWLALAEAVGLTREEVLDERHVQPGVRFAADAYLAFCRTRPWIEAVAASLTELFVPNLMQERIAAFERHYKWVKPSGLGYFKSRLTQAPRDSTHASELVTQYCTTRDEQERARAALAFKLDVLWSMLDAIHQAYGIA